MGQLNIREYGVLEPLDEAEGMPGPSTWWTPDGEYSEQQALEDAREFQERSGGKLMTREVSAWVVVE